ncbi:Asp-tRNA(Asn)/Glu-tRNA(Gln) amidotransferase subunit GatC [Candidatus Bathyarchaeota archaeon]|nr:MAG: Asp-tRNA(Asn)/Glu-tRNA(Gln) amidotransferase subunit GatC [Candidatus Bathyarchaeota archaeon]
MSKQRITKQDVEHIAWLARIELTEEEKELFTKQFNEILQYFSKLDEIDTDGVPPTYHVIEVSNVFRDDEVQESLNQEEALRNAKRKEKGFFKAPRIL